MSENSSAAAVMIAPMVSEVQTQSLVVGLERGAEMLGICKRSIERLRDRGELRCLRIGRHWKVRVSELHQFIRRQEAESSR